MEVSMKTVKSLLILDNDGKRILAKYYDNSYESLNEQKIFEKKLFQATKKSDSEIVLIDGKTVVYKSHVDLFFYIVGDVTENELLLNQILTSLYRSIDALLRHNVEKRFLLNSMEKIYLIVDLMLDSDGILMEIDPISIIKQVPTRREEELDVYQALQKARNRLGL